MSKILELFVTSIQNVSLDAILLKVLTAAFIKNILTIALQLHDKGQ